MKTQTNTSNQVTTHDDASVIDLPRNYRGQKLTDNTINVAPTYARKAAQNRTYIAFLLKQFASEMGCGKTARSRRYLEGLNTGQGYFWTHKDETDIAFVSLAQSEDGSVDRLPLIMPLEQMIREFFTPEKA